ncbi:hypothetical protein L3X38_009224 [Prunus dulcis]|uniref:Uncharacterized protein n=1 Tax=Prunus dulcis TaxID=3755 RepID=A0AAD5F7S7_PRUDU|nr:hypothetical protein L3X38_009224 [Prunus dulcis]
MVGAVYYVTKDFPSNRSPSIVVSKPAFYRISSIQKAYRRLVTSSGVLQVFCAFRFRSEFDVVDGLRFFVVYERAGATAHG